AAAGGSEEQVPQAVLLAQVEQRIDVGENNVVFAELVIEQAHEVLLSSGPPRRPGQAGAPAGSVAHAGGLAVGGLFGRRDGAARLRLPTAQALLVRGAKAANPAQVALLEDVIQTQPQDIEEEHDLDKQGKGHPEIV